VRATATGATSAALGTLGGMWLYLAVATAILVAVTVPLVACARVLALGLSARQREDRRDGLHTRQRALIDRYG
jgi:hypothetical protein